MANKVILSKQFRVKVIDFINGLIPAVGTPVLYFLQEMIPGWDVDPIYKIAAGAFVTYIIHKFIEKPKVTTVYSTNEKATEISKKIKAS